MMMRIILSKLKTTLLVFLLSISSKSMEPAGYGALSIVPGLGQTVNGNLFEGLAWFGASVALIGQKDFKLRMIGQNIWFYNMYDAWRDAGGTPSEKEVPIFSHYFENFNPKHLLDPIAAGVLSFAALGRNSARKRLEEENDSLGNELLEMEAWESIGMFSFVGLGEEALFRGFLFPSISSWAGVWGGAFISSTIFGFVHQGNRQANWFRTALGMIFCWQYHRNQYKLGGNIFTHSWYDQILVGPFVATQAPTDLKGYFKNRPLGLSLTFQY